MPVLKAHGKSLHLYAVPTLANNRAKMQALIDDYPENIVCYPWITNRQELADANNQYRVVISPGATNNLANTFGQSNLEAVACGANLVVLLDDDNQARSSHTGGKYLNYRGRLFHVASDPVELAHAALECLEVDVMQEVDVDLYLQEFNISEQPCPFGRPA